MNLALEDRPGCDKGADPMVRHAGFQQYLAGVLAKHRCPARPTPWCAGESGKAANGRDPAELGMIEFPEMVVCLAPGLLEHLHGPQRRCDGHRPGEETFYSFVSRKFGESVFEQRREGTRRLFCHGPLGDEPAGPFGMIESHGNRVKVAGLISRDRDPTILAGVEPA